MNNLRRTTPMIYTIIKNKQNTIYFLANDSKAIKKVNAVKNNLKLHNLLPKEFTYKLQNYVNGNKIKFDKKDSIFIFSTFTIFLFIPAFTIFSIKTYKDKYQNYNLK